MGIEQCHPMILLVYFASVFYGTVTFRHPVFLVISLVSGAAYCVKRNGLRGVVFSLVLLPLVGIFSLYYASFSHFGVTVLDQNFIGNNLTLESLVYGLILGGSVAGVLLWFASLCTIFTTDKVVYLFGRLSPRLALFLAILLRLVPRIRREARRIHVAQRGIGRGLTQGSLWMRGRNGIRILSMLITWTIDSMTVASESMQSRGSTLRGRRAFSIYRFDNRDRTYVVAAFGAMVVTGMGVLLRQTWAAYDPRIILVPVTPASWFFYGGYACLCLMPLCLELWTEYRFRKSRRNL